MSLPDSTKLREKWFDQEGFDIKNAHVFIYLGQM